MQADQARGIAVQTGDDASMMSHWQPIPGVPGKSSVNR